MADRWLAAFAALGLVSCHFTVEDRGSEPDEDLCASSEVCNGLDDDCDGKVDLPTCGSTAVTTPGGADEGDDDET